MLIIRTISYADLNDKGTTKIFQFYLVIQI